ncbi:MAG: NADH-quinone oxidoreductase subunit N, partial [Myxococcales bacterium]|nr:NADH-quinone oxidoreductase subunit N [Myxococcales bacterium]
MSTESLAVLSPMFVVLVSAFLLMMYEVFSTSPGRAWAANFSVLALGIAGALLLTQLGDAPVAVFASEGLTPIRVDTFSVVASLIVVTAGLLACLLSPSYAANAGHDHGEYYALLLFSVVGMMVMVMACDLITFFVGLETMSVAVYCLCALRTNDRRAAEASLKYFLMGAFSTGFLLFGIAFVYGATGSVSYPAIALALAAGDADATRSLLTIGIVLVLIGFGFKVSAVPFHMWAPDVYEGAPTPVTGFMAVGVKAAAFVALLRVVVSAISGFEGAPGPWLPLLSWMAILTIVVGNAVALVQDNVKRMLAYSSVSHAGYALIGVVAAAKGEPSAGSAVLFYLTGYTFMTLGAFGVLTFLERKDGGPESERYGAYAGVGYRHPALALSMVLFMIALGGLPPTAGFFGKLTLFTAAIRADELGLALVGIFGSIVSIAYYLRVLVAFYMREVPDPGPTPTATGSVQLAA